MLMINQIKKNIWLFFISIFIISDSVPDDLRKISKNDKNGTSIISTVLVFWLFVIVALIFSFLILNNESSVFNVVARTEKVSVTQYKGLSFPPWYIASADFYNCDAVQPREVMGNLTIMRGTEVEFVRNQAGNVEITLLNEEQTSVGKIHSASGDEEFLSYCVVFEIKPEKLLNTLIFPIEGEITLGDVIKEASERNPILLGGEVFLVDKHIFTSEYYAVGPIKLVRGDMFVVKSPLTQSSGFVYVDHNREIKVSYRVKAHQGYIKRYNSEPIKVKNGLFSRIHHDQTFVVLWVFVGFLYKIFQSILRIKMNSIRLE